MQSQSFYSNGKLLLTGEYLVIDGAEALAIPTKKGQSLTVSNIDNSSNLLWKSWTFDKKCWLDVTFSLPSLSIESSSDIDKAKWLQNLLLSAKELNPSFLSKNNSIEVNTKLEFPRNWGLGSSSTLINNIAQWAQVDPFQLHFKISNGSGYDIASAMEESPLVYSINNRIQKIKLVTLNKDFLNQVFFVHLNKKQNSHEAVVSYNDLKKEVDLQHCIESLNQLTNTFIQSNTLKEWEQAINEHEYLLSNILEQETIKEKLFPLFSNSVKSLGAWGGDFVMVTGSNKDIEYFNRKGYHTIIPYKDMVL